MHYFFKTQQLQNTNFNVIKTLLYLNIKLLSYFSRKGIILLLPKYQETYYEWRIDCNNCLCIEQHHYPVTEWRWKLLFLSFVVAKNCLLIQPDGVSSLILSTFFFIRIQFCRAFWPNPTAIQNNFFLFHRIGILVIKLYSSHFVHTEELL